MFSVCIKTQITCMYNHDMYGIKRPLHSDRRSNVNVQCKLNEQTRVSYGRQPIGGNSRTGSIQGCGK